MEAQGPAGGGKGVLRLGARPQGEGSGVDLQGLVEEQRPAQKPVVNYLHRHNPNKTMWEQLHKGDERGTV